MLLGVLFPYLTGLLPVAEVTAQGAPVTVTENIVDAEEVKGDISYTVTEKEVTWEISYEKKATSEANLRRLKMKIDTAGSGIGTVRNLNFAGEVDSNGWYVLSPTYTSARESGKVTFVTDLKDFTVGEQRLAVTFQVDEKVITETAIPAVMTTVLAEDGSQTEVEEVPATTEVTETENNNILGKNSAGPFEIVVKEHALDAVKPVEEVEVPEESVESETPVEPEVPAESSEASAESSEEVPVESSEEAPVEETIESSEGGAEEAESTESNDSGEEEDENNSEPVFGPSVLASPSAKATTNYTNLVPEYSTDNGKYPKNNWSITGNTNVLNHTGSERGTSWLQTGNINNSFINYYSSQSHEVADFGIKKYAQETTTQGLFDVVLEVYGNQINEKEAQLVDILLVADRSGSMVKDGSTRWEDLKSGVNTFITTIKNNNLEKNIHLGYTSFAKNADSSSDSISIGELTTVHAETITNRLDGTNPNGGTNTHAGLKRAKAMLEARITANKTNGRENAKVVMVLLTDGVPTYHQEITSAEKITDANYPDGVKATASNDTSKGNGRQAELTRDAKYYVGTTGGNDRPRIHNNFVGPISVAQEIKAMGVENRVIGIQLTDEEDNLHSENQKKFTKAEIETRMKAIASPIPDGTGEYYYTNVSASAEIVTELGKIAYEFSSTVVNGSISDPLGSQFNYNFSNMSGIRVTDTSEEGYEIPTDLKPLAFLNGNNISISNINLGTKQSVKIQYQVRINTEDENFVPDQWYPMNERTTFKATPDTNPVDFGVPSGKAPGVELKVQKIWEGPTATNEVTINVSRQVENSATNVGSTTVTSPTWVSTFNTVSSNGNTRYLPKFNNRGIDFIYSIDEETVDGYDKTISLVTGKNNEWIVTNTAQYVPLDIRINKVSSEEKTPLKGAEFTIQKSGGELINLIDNEDGSYSLPEGVRLEKGTTYTLTETKAPTGHSLGSKVIWTVVVSSDGKSVTIDGQSIEITDDFISYEIENEFVSVPAQIQKVNAANDAPLVGATFKLMKQDETNWTQVGDSKKSTGDLALATFTGLTPGTYKIVETEGPTGFDTNGREYIFTVDSYGVISAAEGLEKFVVDLEGQTIFTFRHENNLNPFKLTLIKKDVDSGAILPGVEFTLTKDGAVVDEKATGNDGKAIFEDLIAGTYTLSETGPLAGYILLEKDFTFTINPDGSVDSEDDFISSLENNTIEIEVTNKAKAPLPMTGGSGIYTHLMIGMTVMMTILGISVLERKRNRKGAF